MKSFIKSDEIKKKHTLRERSEAILRDWNNKDRDTLSDEQLKSLIQDFRFHQIELELQHEELQNANKTLEFTRNKYSKLYENAPVGYLTIDRSGIIIQANQTFGELVSTPAFELSGTPFFSFVHPSDRDIFLSRFRAFFKKPGGKSMDVQLLDGRGGRTFVRLEGRLDPSGMFMPSADKDMPHDNLLMIVSDISEQKYAEMHMLHMNALLRAIRDINQLIIRENDPERLLKGCCDCLTKHRGYDYAWVWLPENERSSSRLFESGLKESIELMQGMLESEQKPYCLLKAMEEGIAVITNTTEDCGECPLINDYGYHSVMVARIVYGNTVFGTIGISIPEPLKDELEERELISELADDIGYALHNIAMEEKRKDVEERLRHANVVVENSPAVLFCWQAKTGWPVEFVTNNVKHFGFSAEDFLSCGILFESIICSEDRERVKAEVKGHLIAGTKTFMQEYRIVSPDGKMHWVDDRTTVVRDVHGEVSNFQGIILDITERKRAEAEIIESRENLFVTLNSIGDAVIAVDTESRVIRMNPPAVQLTGWNEQDALGKPLLDVFHIINALTKDLVDSPVETVLRENRIVGLANHVQLVSRDGNRYQIADSAAPIRKENEVIGVILVFRDVTEEYRIREELRFQAMLLNQIHDLVVATDMNGNITYVNDSICKLMKRSREQLIGRSVEVFGDDPENGTTQRMLLQYVQLDGRWRGEIVNYDADKRRFVLDTRLWTIYDDRGGSIAYCSIATDITEHKRMEEEKTQLQKQLMQSQKMEAIGTLAGGIAHDFNNILYPIIGYTEMSLEETQSMESVQGYLSEVLKAATRAKDLVNQILAFSRRSEDDLKPVKIHYLLKDVIGMLRSTLPTTIGIRTNITRCGPVSANPTQIQQVVMNLCSNAYHAMRDRGGELEIELLERCRDDITVDFETECLSDDYVELTVRDTGVGIDAFQLQRIFDPYYTTKKIGEGTGLGLFVVDGIVKSHHGTIHVESAPGEGSVFKVYLPVIKVESEESIVYSSDPVPYGDEAVLLVDDEASIVKMVGQILENLGYEVTATTDSIVALELYRNNPDSFDLVITDMTMPGLTGSELAREIQRLRPQARIIICTGFSDLIDEKKAVEIGIHGFIMKPVIKSELAKIIRDTLDRDL